MAVAATIWGGAGFALAQPASADASAKAPVTAPPAVPRSAVEAFSTPGPLRGATLSSSGRWLAVPKAHFIEAPNTDNIASEMSGPQRVHMGEPG